MTDDDIYSELRDQALSVDPTEIGVAPSDDHPNVWGVVMDLGYPEGTATLVGLSDGSTSLYTSSGGGVIGGGDHSTVAEATLRWLRVAEDMLAALEPATEFPLPDAGDVAFTVLTYSGRYRASAPEAALGAGDAPLSPLFYAGHDVITELRHVEEGFG